MLKAHIDAVEANLLALSQIPANAGHSLHKGTPREAFVREFLQGHLSERVAIGTGEIIDANSQPGERRNQIDIVIYKRDYPRLDFGGGIYGYLAESVVATIEVKSVLDLEAVLQATRSAKRVKTLVQNMSTVLRAGYQPPSILSYVVAYDGPARMDTVWKWVSSAGISEGIVYPLLPASFEDQIRVASPGLDAVFVLGKGFMHFGNVPSGFFNSGALEQNADLKWAVCEASRGSLLLLFLFLTSAVSGASISLLNPGPYLSSFTVPNCSLRP